MQKARMYRAQGSAELATMAAGFARNENHRLVALMREAREFDMPGMPR